MFDQELISKDIFNYSRKLFGELNILYTTDEIKEAISIFFNMARMDVPFALLRGFPDQIEDVLTKICISEVGQVTPLRGLATLMDSFMKRSLHFAGVSTYSNYGGKTSAPLVNILGVFGTFTYSGVNESWRTTKPEHYIIANSIIPRNDITHNAPDWDKAEVMEIVKYTLATAILIVLKLRSQLVATTPEVLNPPIKKAVLTDEDMQAFDFLNYSKTTRDLKNQILECFILRTLFKEGRMNEDQLIPMVTEFIGKDSSEIVPPRLRKLQRDNLIIVNEDLIDLDPTERTKLAQSESNCAINKESFCNKLADMLGESHDSPKTTEAYEVFSNFLKERYLQTAEIIITDANSQDPDNSFIRWLTTHFHDSAKAKDVYRAIIEECNRNDIVYRLCIGSVISSLTDVNEDIFAIQRMTRYIFLDTQIVLAMLCMSFNDFGHADIPTFRQANSILKIARAKDQYLKLVFCQVYQPEVVGHIRQAIGLSSWDDLPIFDSGQFSQNVFYQHFIALKRRNELPEDTPTFQRYLEVLFNMEPDDFDRDLSRFKQYTLPEIIEATLENNGIEYREIRYYEPPELKKSGSTFEAVMRNTQTFKGEGTLKRDAIMGQYLFDRTERPRPFFITRDSTFSSYREQYINTYLRGKSYFWQLFSPLKFLNNHNLIGMKVNKDLLSEDLLLLIEDDHTKMSARNFMDVNINMTDIDGLSEAEKRARQKKNFKIFAGKEMADLTEGELDTVNELANNVNRAWDNIINELSDSTFNGMGFFRILQNEEIYTAIIEEVNTYVKEKSQDKTKLLSHISTLLNHYSDTRQSTEDK